MSRVPRRPRWPWTTLLLSVALAGTLGATVYFTVSSLPFLASSPSADPTFGALNACLHAAVPARSGFAAGRDARRALAWSTSVVVRCRAEGDAVASDRWELAGVTVGAFDDSGAAWVVSQPGGLASTLHRLEGSSPDSRGELAALALTGTASGVVALEPSGRLVAVDASGAVGGVAEVPVAGPLALSTSADGRRVAVTGDGAVRIYEAATLAPVRREAPCDVDGFWWLKTAGQALVTCRPDGLALVVSVDSGAQDTAPQATRTRSVLAGPGGPWVEACDLLPCTSRPPLEAP
ncbi:MAG: hypothetical protein INH41_05845 [Myxococcaceae bacterium]|jgi:hypothetical protein|nr:hypothetical protein [Myxococcaceae bacterium]MCA3011908.1 hypothetical protein [Myxococcaceae bacterium]